MDQSFALILFALILCLNVVTFLLRFVAKNTVCCFAMFLFFQCQQSWAMFFEHVLNKKADSPKTAFF